MWTPDAPGSPQTVLFEEVKDTSFSHSCTGRGRSDSRSRATDDEWDGDNREAKRFRSCSAFDGSVHRVPTYKRGGRVFLDFSHILIWAGAPAGGSGGGDNDGLEDPQDDSEIIRQLLRRERQSCFDRYVAEGRCTTFQLRTIRALWWFEEGTTLRKHALDEKVKPAAISSRIKGLKRKAPEFYNYWTHLNANRRGLKRRPSSRTVH